MIHQDCQGCMGWADFVANRTMQGELTWESQGIGMPRALLQRFCDGE